MNLDQKQKRNISNLMGIDTQSVKMAITEEQRALEIYFKEMCGAIIRKSRYQQDGTFII